MCIYINIWLSTQFSPRNFGLGYKSFDSLQKVLLQLESLPTDVAITRTLTLQFLSLALGLMFSSSFTHIKRAGAMSYDSWKTIFFFERSNQCGKRSICWHKRVCVLALLSTAQWGLWSVFQSQQPILWFSGHQLNIQQFNSILIPVIQS